MIECFFFNLFHRWVISCRGSFEQRWKKAFLVIVYTIVIS